MKNGKASIINPARHLQNLSCLLPTLHTTLLKLLCSLQTYGPNLKVMQWSKGEQTTANPTDLCKRSGHNVIVLASHVTPPTLPRENGLIEGLGNANV
jgi:hypothetical protein